MSKILITGSRGVIGSVLTEGLARDHDVLGLDLPDGDILNYEFLLEQMQGADIVIHVAHAKGESWKSESINPVNVALEMNVFSAVNEAKVKRLIMASSVHADDFNRYEGTEPLTVPGSFHPTSPYGGHKIVIEEMGKFYSKHNGIEFIGVRFGGVTRDNSVKSFLKEPQVWLSHRDLLDAVTACVTALVVPKNFVLFYAVSANDGRLHSTENPFGWAPRDNSKDHMSDELPD